MNSRIILGCWNFGDDYWVPLDGKRIKTLLKGAISCGITHFDTAIAYGNGKSEQILSHQLRKLEKEQFISPDFQNSLRISSKAVLKSNRSIQKDLETSLKRMNLASLDCYYIHWPLSGVDPAPTVEVLNRCKKQGLIKRVGVSNFTPSLLKQALRGGEIDCCQMGYNLLWRLPDEELIPLCLEKKIRPIFYSPLAQGILSGRYPSDLNFQELGNKQHLALFEPALWQEICPLVEEMCMAVSKRKHGLAGVAIGWLLAKVPEAHIVLGASSSHQLKESLSYLTENENNQETKSLYAQLDRISLIIKGEVQKTFPHADNIFNHNW